MQQARQLAELPFVRELAAWYAAGKPELLLHFWGQLAFMVGDWLGRKGGAGCNMTAAEARALARQAAMLAHISRGPSGTGASFEAAQLPLLAISPATNRESRANYAVTSLLALEGGRCFGVQATVLGVSMLSCDGRSLLILRSCPD